MKKIIGAVFGVALGLFIGLLIVGTFVRLIFSLMFGWGDSAPTWGMWTEAVLIVGITILITFYTTKWSMGNNSRSK